MLICQTDQREIKATFSRFRSRRKDPNVGKRPRQKEEEENEKRKQHLPESSSDKEKTGGEQT